MRKQGVGAPMESVRRIRVRKRTRRSLDVTFKAAGQEKSTTGQKGRAPSRLRCNRTANYSSQVSAVFQVFWDIHNFAEGPIIKGSVGPNRIIFKGSATA